MAVNREDHEERRVIGNHAIVKESLVTVAILICMEGHQYARSILGTVVSDLGVRTAGGCPPNKV